jgi:hypothetical protein
MQDVQKHTSSVNSKIGVPLVISSVVYHCVAPEMTDGLGVQSDFADRRFSLVILKDFL